MAMWQDETKRLKAGICSIFAEKYSRKRRHAVTKYPKNYVLLKKKFDKLMQAYEESGRLAAEGGPINEKTANLVQLAACVAQRSEGGVHSHARRAMEAGASMDEIYQVIAILMNTVGFPAAAAAFSWVNDLTKKKKS
jgi:4-carboxymuconolactone decarboxylase